MDNNIYEVILERQLDKETISKSLNKKAMGCSEKFGK